MIYGANQPVKLDGVWVGIKRISRAVVESQVNTPSSPASLDSQLDAWINDDNGPTERRLPDGLNTPLVIGGYRIDLESFVAIDKGLRSSLDELVYKRKWNPRIIAMGLTKDNNSVLLCVSVAEDENDTISDSFINCIDAASQI